MKAHWKRLLAVLFLGVIPGFGVIIKDAGNESAYYGIPDAANNIFNGIAGINGNSCTGFAISLNVVLTAAHCVSGGGTPQVTFWLPDANPGGVGTQTFTPTSVLVNPLFNSSNLVNGYDIALLRFDDGILPDSIHTYPVYDFPITGPTEFELFGRGRCGSPLTGSVVSEPNGACADGVDLHRATNRYDQLLGSNILLYDFTQSDTPTNHLTNPAVDCPATSALCYVTHFAYGEKDSLGGKQGIAVFGDSGGPSLINLNGVYYSVGLHSFIGCDTGMGLFACVNPPDIDGSIGPNGTFGEYAGDTYLYALSHFIQTGENVPEPGTWALAIGGFLVLDQMRRKRIR